MEISTSKKFSPRRTTNGSINKVIEENNLRIIAQKRIKLSLEQAENFYSVHKDKPFFEELLVYITSGPVVVAVIEGNNAIGTTRQMVGATKSFEAEPGSIRGDFGLGFTENIIHASDSAESFDKEVNVVFQ